MRIAITGITGFIGGFLARYLTERCYQVVGIGRRPLPEQHQLRSFLSDYIVHALDSDRTSVDWRDIDGLIHGAYDAHPGKIRTNINGTLRLAEAARDGGVRYQILISSYAALRPESSDYAMVKATLEQHFSRFSSAIVRPGLVVGKGGLYQRMDNLVHRFPVLPLLDGGRTPVPLLSIEDLLLVLEKLLCAGSEGTFNLFYPEVPTLKQLLSEMARKSVCRKRFFIPVPISVAYYPLWLAERLRLKLSISTGNLAGVRANRSVHAVSDLRNFTGSGKNWNDAI